MLSNEHTKTVCLMGQGEKCCKYLVFSGQFECVKLTPMRHTIDAQTHMRAKGDNCDGIDHLADFVLDKQRSRNETNNEFCTQRR